MPTLVCWDVCLLFSALLRKFASRILHGARWTAFSLASAALYCVSRRSADSAASANTSGAQTFGVVWQNLCLRSHVREDPRAVAVQQLPTPDADAVHGGALALAPALAATALIHEALLDEAAANRLPVLLVSVGTSAVDGQFVQLVFLQLRSAPGHCC